MTMYSPFDPDHEFTVGERVILTGPSRGPHGRKYEEATVEKVGRTLVHVKIPGAVLKFYMKTRDMKTDFVGRTLFTPEEYEGYQRRIHLIKTLREDHRIVWDYGPIAPPTKALEEILAVLERYREDQT